MEELKLGNRGSTVLVLQRTLNKVMNESILEDGVFGKNTESLLNKYLRSINLEETGILNTDAFKSLAKYISVPTDVPYDSSLFLFNIYAFMYKYTFLDFDIIGNSVMEKNIYSVIFGKGKNKVIYVGGTHANEWITVPLLMKYIENISDAYINNLSIYGKSARDIFNLSSLYFVPCLNPDGIDLVILGMNSAKNYSDEVLKIANNYPDIRFPDGWKANVLGIDLNLQFPAGWEEAKKLKYNMGYINPAPRDFVGNYPLEAPEVIAIYDYITTNNFNILLTYHSQGKVIYYKYLDYNPLGATIIGEKLSAASGYLLQTTPSVSGFAGLKDWFIYKYLKPGYTIEVGSGQNPLDISEFDKIYSDNIGMLTIAATITAK